MDKQAISKTSNVIQIYLVLKKIKYSHKHCLKRSSAIFPIGNIGFLSHDIGHEIITLVNNDD